MFETFCGFDLSNPSPIGIPGRFAFKICRRNPRCSNKLPSATRNPFEKGFLDFLKLYLQNV